MERNFKLWVFIFIFPFSLLPLKLNAAQELSFPDPSKSISMDFQDANLKDILKIFSMQAGLNFIASEAVQDRKITLYLDKVPIQDVMDKLFKANNLSYELDCDANIFIVKDWGVPQLETVTRVFYLKHATVSSSSLKEELRSQVTGGIAATSGATATGATASGTGGAGQGGSGGSAKWQSESEAGLTKAVIKLLSRYGSVIEDYRTNSLIITDIPSRIPIIAQTIALLDVVVPQVLIDVEMLDVSKDIVDKLGFEFGDNPFTLILPGGKGGKFYFGAKSDRDREGGITLGHTYAHLIDFLRTQAETKYLARPRLLTLNNETAEISITKDEVVGRQETTVSGTTTTTSIEFIRSTDLTLTREGTGIYLRVTPQVNTETNEITMVINPKSSITSPSTLSGASQQADAEVRSTRSIVKLKDGETVIVGGLIHTDKRTVIKKLPILGDIPFVGALFRHKNQTKDIERELLVFITPHILKDANMEFAQAKKTTFPNREQGPVSAFDQRRIAISASLNSFEKKR